MWPFPKLANALSYHEEDENCDRIREKLVHYSELLDRDGYKVKPYLDESLPIISQASIKHRKIASALTQVAIAAHEQPISADPLVRTKHYIWRALQKLDLTPKADFMDLIEKDHVVEFYSRDHRQIYRNLRFFELTPLSLEEVVGFDWTQTTERDAKLTASAISIAARMTLGLIRETIPLHEAFPTHQARWKTRADVPNLEVSLLYGSPLFRKGNIVAFALIHRCRMLERTE